MLDYLQFAVISFLKHGNKNSEEIGLALIESGIEKESLNIYGLLNSMVFKNLIKKDADYLTYRECKFRVTKAGEKIWLRTNNYYEHWMK